MEEIELSIMAHEGPRAPTMQAVLQDFESKYHIRVKLTVLPFIDQWSRVVQMALYKDGPDVSSIGTTWLSDLVRMNAIRAFQPSELHALGGEQSFIPASLRSALMAPAHGLSTEKTMWGAPWSADTRVVCFRRDLFEKSGIDPATAFQTPEQFEETLIRLRDSGVKTPLVIPTHDSWVALHTLACWVWGAGGTFLNSSDTAITFNEAQARAGMIKYFRLGRYISPEARNLDDDSSQNMFWRGEAAMTIGGHWTYFQAADPAIRERISIGHVPGVPFVGGYHLVIWGHSRKEMAALKLVEYLTGRQMPHSLYPTFGLPPRKDVLAQADFLQAPPVDVLKGFLEEGRSFPAARMWGSIEKKLVDLLPTIWQEVFASPNPDIENILNRHMTPLANRLTLSLKSLSA